VDLLVDEVARHSVALVPPPDGIDEPQAPRRTDGSSVYTVAGAFQSCTRASQRSRRPTQVRCPGCRAFHQRFMPIPSGASPGKRSQLVADLADQVQDHACEGADPPTWATPESHLSTALVGEIAVWRAANGINPQDPRPTGGTPLETLPALWKQRLDRAIACATYPPADARADERQAAQTALRRGHDHSQRNYQKPEQRPRGSAPRR
jgi:hypothetical protein